MVKLFTNSIKENLSAASLKKEVGEIKIFDEDGNLNPLSGEELYKYLQDKFNRGKTLTLAKKEMIRDGIEKSQYKKREEIMALLEQIASGDK